MNIYQSIVLGVIEGFTEFLPISSTGHLIIAQKILGLPAVDDFMTVVIQSGAILSALVYFRHKIWDIIQHKRVVVLKLLISMLPVLLVGFAVRKLLENYNDTILLIAISSIVGGIFFYVVEKFYAKKATRDLESGSFLDYLGLGVVQILSLIPGFSRSGSAIAGGLINNIKLKDSIEISFLMGIPLLLIATLYKLVSHSYVPSPDLLINTGVATVVAFGVGLAGIKLTLGWVQKYGFRPFMYYRIGLGVILLVAYFAKLI